MWNFYINHNDDDNISRRTTMTTNDDWYGFDVFYDCVAVCMSPGNTNTTDNFLLPGQSCESINPLILTTTPHANDEKGQYKIQKLSSLLLACLFNHKYM
jgi:hypothetical protein